MRDHGVLADGHGTSLRVVTASSSTQVDHSVAQPFYDVIITPVTIALAAWKFDGKSAVLGSDSLPAPGLCGICGRRGCLRCAR